MLTKLTIRNFKGLKDVEIELGQHVVFVGPNNSGKTTALQALALWYAGVQKWQADVARPEISDVEFLSFAINRLDLVSLPAPNTELLLTDLGISNNRVIPITVKVDGVSDNQQWVLDFRFAYENAESLLCSLENAPGQVRNVHICPQIHLLPAMSGLIAVEPRIEPGRINVLIGEGRTAEVLRNLCYLLYERNGSAGHWDKVVRHIREQFGVELLPPEYLPGRGEIRMFYKERSGITLDLSASGRGMLQVLLLLAYLYNNPGAVVLLDEPDAHLEIIRQNDIYRLLTDVAREQGSQIIAATHSEVILEKAAELDMAIAFLGKPHRIDKNNISQVKKALAEIPAVDYFLAEQTGWVLFLEGESDRAILQSFAARLKHPAASILERAFVHILHGNRPSDAEKHFHGLREAKPDLVGLALYDRLKSTPKTAKGLTQITWKRREIENYLAQPATLLAYAGDSSDGEARVEAMQEVINLLVPRIALDNLSDEWWIDRKLSDEFLDRLFTLYFERIGLPNLMRKTNYHVLANFVPVEQIDPEVTEKLDAILAVAQQATPRED